MGQLPVPSPDGPPRVGVLWLVSGRRPSCRRRPSWSRRRFLESCFLPSCFFPSCFLPWCFLPWCFSQSSDFSQSSGFSPSGHPSSGAGMMSRPPWWRLWAASALFETVIWTYGFVSDPVAWQIVVLPWSLFPWSLFSSFGPPARATGAVLRAPAAMTVSSTLRNRFILWCPFVGRCSSSSPSSGSRAADVGRCSCGGLPSDHRRRFLEVKPGKSTEVGQFRPNRPNSALQSQLAARHLAESLDPAPQRRRVTLGEGDRDVSALRRGWDSLRPPLQRPAASWWKPKTA